MNLKETKHLLEQKYKDIPWHSYGPYSFQLTDNRLKFTFELPNNYSKFPVHETDIANQVKWVDCFIYHSLSIQLFNDGRLVFKSIPDMISIVDSWEEVKQEPAHSSRTFDTLSNYLNEQELPDDISFIMKLKMSIESSGQLMNTLEMFSNQIEKK